MLLSLLNGNEARRVKDSLNKIKCSLWIEPLSYDLSTSSLWELLPFWELLPEITCLFLYRNEWQIILKLTFFCVFLEKYEWHPFQNYHACNLHLLQVLGGRAERASLCEGRGRRGPVERAPAGVQRDSGPGPSSALAGPVSLGSVPSPGRPPCLPATQDRLGDLQSYFQRWMSVVLRRTGQDNTDSFRAESHLGKCQGFSQGAWTHKRTRAFY